MKYLKIQIGRTGNGLNVWEGVREGIHVHFQSPGFLGIALRNLLILFVTHFLLSGGSDVT